MLGTIWGRHYAMLYGMEIQERQKSRRVNLPNHSFLVRLWHDGDNETWRATVLTATTGERRHFADVEHLLSFLRSHTESEHSLEGA